MEWKHKHIQETFYYSLARMLERGAYYGLRATVVLYMIGETLKMDRAKALEIYGWLSISIIFSGIIGALLGDLLIGNKKSIIIGGILQALGAFILCIPSVKGLYVGVFFIVLGSGFFTPNIIANYGKLYLNKPKLLDAGFTIFYLAVNIGAFFGVLLIGYLGEAFGYNTSFIISGVLIIVSLMPIVLSKEKPLDKIEKKEFSISKRVLSILLAFIVVGLFWGFYQISSFRSIDLQLKLSEVSTLGIPKEFWGSLSAVFIMPISLFVIVLWSFFYSSQFFKLMIGFVFGTISFGVLLLIPEVPSEEYAITYLFSLFFLGISEAYIAPIIHSILTKYSNPKYLAILISLAFLPAKIAYVVISLFNESLYMNPILGLKIGTIGMIVMSVVFVGLLILSKKINFDKTP